jgi:hypothetical protein
MSMVYRAPDDTVNWTVLRPTSLEGANQLQEWKTMMSSWPIDEEGSVSIPHEETMMLRAAFDLFDADKSGALDYSEVRTAMESCGMLLTDKEIHDVAAHIDKDGSGTFDFAEFIELVKVLLVRLREAQEAADSIEDMLEVLSPLFLARARSHSLSRSLPPSLSLSLALDLSHSLFLARAQADVIAHARTRTHTH